MITRDRLLKWTIGEHVVLDPINSPIFKVADCFIYVLARIFPKHQGREEAKMHSWGWAEILKFNFEYEARTVVIQSEADSFNKVYRNPSSALGFHALAGNSVSFDSEDYRGSNGYGTDPGDPDTPLCPKCILLGGVGRLPLGAKIAFCLPLRVVAWLTILKGFDFPCGLRERRVNLFWLTGGIAIAGILLVIGII